MAMYWTCPYGANHDPGEKCDCAEVAEKERKKRKQLYVTENRTGQMTFNWHPERTGT